MSDPCGNITITTNSTLSLSWEDLGGIQPFPRTISSYLRPDGFALLPWIYTAIVLVVHIPTVIIRVLKWEWVQLWCLGGALFTVIVYVIAYASTQLTPDKILVWTPLLLLIDAGSMSQIFFLILDGSHAPETLWTRIKKEFRLRFRITQ